MCASRQRGGVREIFRCIHFITTLLEKRAEIGQKIAGTIDTDNFGPRGSRSLRGRLWALGESCDRFTFCAVGVKQLLQIGGLKDLLEKGRQPAKFEISPRGSEGPEQAHYRPQSAAIDISNARQLENKLLRFQKRLFYLRSQGLRFLSGDNPPLATDYSEIPDHLASTNKLHWRETIAQNSVCDAENVALRGGLERKGRRKAVRANPAHHTGGMIITRKKVLIGKRSKVMEKSSTPMRETHMKTAKVKWGVLGTAAIAVRDVIPAMQKGAWSEVTAIASRDAHKAKDAAKKLGIPQAYGSYEALLADPEIEAIYNPLPNHLHVPWSINAAEAGKHVLCEKPLSLTVAEAKTLLAARDGCGVKIGEAFMVKTHPQWLRTRELVRRGVIGELRAIVGAFSYFNRDPKNVRNVAEWGGGGLMDIGCYPITTSRWIFGEEPLRVAGIAERDPEFGTDRLASAILEFPSGQSVFTCGTQLVRYQRMQFLGTKGRIEIKIPFNAPNDRPCEILVDDGRDALGSGVMTEVIPTCNQYTVQGDAFSRAIREGSEVPVPLEDAIANMAVIEAVFRAAESGKWEKPEEI